MSYSVNNQTFKPTCFCFYVEEKIDFAIAIVIAIEKRI